MPQSIRIGRSYKLHDFGKVVKTELHHLSDASSIAYGQCSYIRQVDEFGRVISAYLFVKARVAPLKVIAIPRLELGAAVLSVKHSLKMSWNYLL